MAETPKTNPVVNTPFAFNKQAVEDKLNKVLTHLDTQKGLKNHNPYLKVKALGLDKLLERLKKGEASKALQDEVMALPDAPSSVIDPNYVEPVVTKEASKPLGLKL